MLRVTIASLQPGMINGRNIYSASGKLLLAENTVINETIIGRLQGFGLNSIYIKTPELDDLGVAPPHEILHETTKQHAVNQVQSAFQSFSKTRTIDVSGMKTAVNSIIDDIINNRDALIHLSDIRTHDDYTFGHSVSVCLLAAITGLKLNYNDFQLREMALGALLHDVGKMLVPQEILNKPGELTPEELDIVRQHSEHGFDILRKKDEIPLLAAHVAYQHHEDYNGGGYCRGLKGNDIHEYARIVAVADMFDALSADRPYRAALLPHEAYEIISASSGARLDPAIAAVFLENVAVYPINSVVVLSSGEIGIVVELLPKLPTRPIVKVISPGFKGGPAEKSRIVDLSTDLTLFISRVLKADDVLKLTKTLKQTKS